MSIFSTALTSALSAISTAKGEELAFRTIPEGAFAVVSGFVLHRDRPVGAAYDEQHKMSSYATTGVFKGPLTPTMFAGYQVKDGNGDIWSIEQVLGDNQQICAIRRKVAKTLGPDRGATSR